MLIVFDSVRTRHLVRRFFWRLLDRDKPSPRGTCMDCGDELTPDEAKYYEHTCEMCEGIRLRQLEDADK
jgi:hypothetical protein